MLRETKKKVKAFKKPGLIIDTKTLKAKKIIPLSILSFLAGTGAGIGAKVLYNNKKGAGAGAEAEAEAKADEYKLEEISFANKVNVKNKFKSEKAKLFKENSIITIKLSEEQTRLNEENKKLKKNITDKRILESKLETASREYKSLITRKENLIRLSREQGGRQGNSFNLFKA